MEFPKTASGTAKLADDADLEKDDYGITGPNLHRRIDPKEPEDESLAAPSEYMIGVYDGLNSTRLTTKHYHDEESTTCEIP